MKKTLLVTSLLIALVFAANAANAQTDQENAGLTPKNFFYFLDTFGEWLDLKLTFNVAKKVEKKLDYANERLAELKTLEDAGELEKKHADKINKDYEDLNKGAEQDIEDLKTAGQDVSELIKKMEELLSEHTAKLEIVLEKVPEQAKDAIEHAMEVSKKGHERAIEALEKEIEEGDIDEEELSDDTKDELDDAREKKHGVKVDELRLDDEGDSIDEMLRDIEDGNSLDIDSELNSL